MLYDSVIINISLVPFSLGKVNTRIASVKAPLDRIVQYFLNSCIKKLRWLFVFDFFLHEKIHKGKTQGKCYWYS